MHPNERDARDVEGRTPLHVASMDGNVDVVRALLAAGALVAPSDRQGWTPLHFAARGQHHSVIAALLDAGSPIDPYDIAGHTPLFRAVFAFRDDGRAIELLLARGADPDLSNRVGVSPRKLANMMANGARRFFVTLSP